MGDGKTRAFFCGSVSNLSLQVFDVEEIADQAHSHDLPLITDSTFSTPALTRALDYGADIMIQLERFDKSVDAIGEESFVSLWETPVESSNEESIYQLDLIFAKGGGIIVVVGSSRESGNGKDHGTETGTMLQGATWDDSLPRLGTLLLRMDMTIGFR